MLRVTDIVGYTFNADVYCTDCTGSEDTLEHNAEILGIDREDEASFDSSEFPKVIFRDQSAEIRCGECGVFLADVSPH